MTTQTNQDLSKEPNRETHLPVPDVTATAPVAPDNTADEHAAKDNLHTDRQQDSPNGMDSITTHDGEDGRNIRAMGSQDMDSANGVLRFNDQDDSTMQVTEAAKASIAASAAQTATDMTSPTISPDQRETHLPVPDAQANAQTPPNTGHDRPADATNEADEEEVAQTGTDLNFQPAA